VIEKLFQGVAGVVGLYGDRPQISGVAKPNKKLVQRIAAFECQATGLVRAADEILEKK
jgi:hypothetical protein